MPRQTLKKRPDGRYVCKYKDKFFYGKTQGEALAARDAYKRQESIGQAPKNKTTFAEYSILWLYTYKANVKHQTFAQYARYLDRAKQLLPDGAMADITPSDVQRMYNLALQDMGEWTINKFTTVVRSCFEGAFNDQLIPRNPCRAPSVSKPAGAIGSHRAITPWERQLVLQAVGGHKVSLFAMVLLYAGLRRGEALQLDIDRDVDFDAGLLSVLGAISFDSNQPVKGTTKTKAGIRTVPLFRPLQDALQGKHGLLLPNASGEIMSQVSFRHAWASYLRYLSELHGAPVHFTPHDLRHSFCTMLYDADVDVKTAASWMGHADEKMILRIYAHLSDLKRKNATEKVQAYVENYVENVGK